MTPYENVAQAVVLLAKADHEIQEDLGAVYRPVADALRAAISARGAMRRDGRYVQSDVSGNAQ